MSDNLSYEQLKNAALNAASTAGEMLSTAQSELDLQVIEITLQGAQVFATLAVAAADEEGNRWFRDKEEARKSNVRPIKPSLN